MAWILLWRKIGLALLIILLPTPYYIRLLIYYMFESTEVSFRAAEISFRLTVVVSSNKITINDNK